MVCACLNLTWPGMVLRSWGSKKRVAAEERGACALGRREDPGLFGDEGWTHLGEFWDSIAPVLTLAH